ncbi:MAG: DMT family transporter [Rhodomicrobiaceae bacterium]
MEPALNQLNPARPRSPRLGIGRPEAALIAVTAVWGGTFLVVQNALSASGAFFFVGARFAAAALLIALLTGRSLHGLTWAELRAGCAIGVAIMLGYSLQTIGLETILSSKSAFLTALAIPLVPIMQWLFLRRTPPTTAWIGICLAFTGVLLLTGANMSSLDFSKGELVTALCAVAFAAEIIMIGAFAGKVDARRVTVVQLAAASFFSFIAMVPAGEAVPPFSWLLFLSVAGMAAASAAIQLAMNWAQKTVSPTRATVIYAGEPVWAGLFGRLAGEILGARALFGGALIVIAVIVSQWRSRSGDVKSAADAAK